LVRQEKPDIALVDLRLRGGDNGLDTITQLRRLYSGLPAILVSGDTAKERLQAAATAGVELLAKPVSVTLLQQAMVEACERHREDPLTPAPSLVSETSIQD
jgi:CheY-like chemotaxis protein